MNMNHFTSKKLIAAAVLIAFGAGGRYLLQDVPNIETITVVSLLAGSLLGGPWTIVVGLSTVAITDIFIGNTSILFYTWSAWAVMGVFGYALHNRKKRIVKHSLELTGMGVLGTAFFFLITNFGVWHLSGMYAHTVSGLMLSYTMALPFLRMSMISTLLIVPSVSVVALALWTYAPQLSFLNKNELAREYAKINIKE